MPVFGDQTKYIAGGDLSNIIISLKSTCPMDGVAQSITVWLDCWDADFVAKCAIYAENKTTIIGSTIQKCIEFYQGWQTFDFVGTKPNLRAKTIYYLAAWSNGAYVRGDSAGAIQRDTYDNHAYDGWPDISGDPEYDCLGVSIYCTYITGNLHLLLGLGHDGARIPHLDNGIGLQRHPRSRVH